MPGPWCIGHECKVHSQYWLREELSAAGMGVMGKGKEEKAYKHNGHQ